MLDKNGVEMKTGHIVRIEGAYFKNDNGVFRIKHTPNDQGWMGKDYCLKKVNAKNLTDSVMKYSTNFFPLRSFTNDRAKNAMAKEHNAKHVTIEVIGYITMYKVKTTHGYHGNESVDVSYMNESELAEAKKETRWNTRVEVIEVIDMQKV